MRLQAEGRDGDQDEEQGGKCDELKRNKRERWVSEQSGSFLIALAAISDYLSSVFIQSMCISPFYLVSPKKTVFSWTQLSEGVTFICKSFAKQCWGNYLETVAIWDGQ